MSVVLAFDLSSSATGICTDDQYTWTYSPPKDCKTLLSKAQLISIEAFITARKVQPDLIVIEAIGTRFVATAIAMATVHALVLDRVEQEATLPVLAVDPKSLKKFATDNGNADKTKMLLAAKREGWVDPPDADDNQADAWWLWVLGKAMLGEWVVPETEYRKAILKRIKEGAK